ncbi:trehalose-phosphatase [Corynebacterium sp. 22KM0430]|uniref:trehalose-phosphatase n=1 Tax=Corynebacterium sp. 22KM0430 TaxID=2989735 RepID=UPI0029CA3DCF|nr:trehalose-phosphatase [Corynebacterium sp. 22KM0430]WPF65823.1 trehalose-phosphatase [Corynebacterium sp. 22KM0430]
MSLSSTVSPVAQAPRLLVVSDFDGTLAGISEDPMNVPVEATSIAALSALAGMPDTRVFILSGRNLAQLDVVCPTKPPILRVGSHGAEPEGHEATLTPKQRAALDALAAELESLCEGVEGAFVEYKPYQRVFHYIRVRDEALMRRLLDEVAALDPHGTHVTWGKRVVEFSVSTATKGTWLSEDIARWQPQATVFLGDDTTDEHGFEVLGENDLSVKVGPGDTVANTRVSTIAEVGELLHALAHTRAERIDVATLTPEQRYHLAAAEMAAVLAQVGPEHEEPARAALAPLLGDTNAPTADWAAWSTDPAHADATPEIMERAHSLAAKVGARTYFPAL